MDLRTCVECRASLDQANTSVLKNYCRECFDRNVQQNLQKLAAEAGCRKLAAEVAAKSPVPNVCFSCWQSQEEAEEQVLQQSASAQHGKPDPMEPVFVVSEAFPCNQYMKTP